MTREEIVSLRRHAFLTLKGYYVASMAAADCIGIEMVQIEAAYAMYAAAVNEALEPDRQSFAAAVMKTFPVILAELKYVTVADARSDEQLNSAIESLEGLLMMATEAETQPPGQQQEGPVP